MEFLNSQWFAEVSMWATMLVLGILAWYMLPERVRRGMRWLWLHFVDKVGGWLVAVYAAIWRALVGLLRALWGEPPPAREAAPVSRVFLPLPAAAAANPAPYVAEPALGPRQSDPSAPSAVRPSAPSAPREADPAPTPPELSRLMVDRSRATLVEALVAAGWGATAIREVLKGTNAAIGAEVDAAAERLARGGERFPDLDEERRRVIA